MKTRLLSSAFLIAALSAPSAFAANFYVTSTGNDGNPGNQAQPFRTIRKAVTVVNPGDTVFISRGTYTGAVNITRSGTSAAWITISALPGELPIIDGAGGIGTGFGSSTAQFIKVVGIAVRNFPSSGFGNGWVNDVGTSNGNWQFINCIADANGINGITFYNATGLLIDESIVAHNGNVLPSWSSGVNLFHVSGDFTTNIVRRTVSFENIDITTDHSNPVGGATDGSGFILDQNSSGALFENNIGFRNGGSCIRINTPGAHIVNNTCYHNGLNPIDRTPANPGEIYFSSGPQGAVMVNNLLAASGYNNTMTAVVNGPTGTSFVNNVSVNMNGPTPFFANPTGNDFTLMSTATTVADKGSTMSAPATDIGFDPKCIKAQSGQPVTWWSYAIDYDYIQSVGGIPGCFHPAMRPAGAAPDIGAYEFGGTLVPSDAGVGTGAGGSTGTGGARDAGTATGAGGSTGGGGNRPDAGGSSSGGAPGSGRSPGNGGASPTGTGGGSSATGGAVTGAGGSSGAGVGGSAGQAGSAAGAGTEPGSPPEDTRGGCACRVGAPSHGAGGALLLALGSIAAAARRRRRAASCDGSR